MRAHVVVDGSNIATEGRAKPSLAQLNEAVLSFMKEFPHTVVTVVVDATFSYRIDRKEQVEFEQAIEANELVTPPAGAVGRGDAFVLGIADKVDASVLSNDSYQEFHGQYPWLFNEGRLIGGKPVPHVGWVFVERLPVRGPVSRQAMKAGGKMVAKSPRRGSAVASQPLPVPKSPPPRPATGKSPSRPATGKSPSPRAAVGRTSAPRPAAAKGEAVPRQYANDLLPFLSFVENNPIGTKVRAIVEAYSAHGATVTIGDVRGYVPLHLLASPAPRSARDHLRVGQSVALTVAGFTPARRSIELGVPAMVPVAKKRAAAPAPRKSNATTKKAATRPATKSATKSASKSTSKSAAKSANTPAVRSTTNSRSMTNKTAAKRTLPAKKASAPATARTTGTTKSARASTRTAAAPPPKRSASRSEVSSSKKSSVAKRTPRRSR